MKDQIKKKISEKQGDKKRKKINTSSLEEEFKKDIKQYFENNGYQQLVNAIEELIEEGSLEPMQVKKTNGKYPSLPLHMWLNPKEYVFKWDKVEMAKISEHINFLFYLNNPKYQNDETWKNIKNIYHFFKTKNNRKEVSVEERSLELFGHEKYLTDSKSFPHGEGLLKRLGLRYEDLLMTKFGEPFVFWLKTDTSFEDIENVLIVENLSFFHTAVRLLEEEKLDYHPEVIIYGEGKKIEKSFNFFFKLFPDKPYNFYYVGDIDPEGYGIYSRLANRFEERKIEPAITIYQKMLKKQHQKNTYENQVENEHTRDYFVSKFDREEDKKIFLRLWEEKKRVPQEVLTTETWEAKE